MNSIWTTLYLLTFYVGLNAQSPHTNFSIATGLMKVASADDALGSYKFEGTSGLFRVAASRQKKIYEHNLQFVFGSPTLRSSIQNTSEVKSQFYFLQYAFQRQIITGRKTLLWIGPGLSTRVSARNFENELTGEAIGSLEFCLKASRPISKSSHVVATANLPILNFLAHRRYGLSSDIDYEIASWNKFHSFQFQLAYVLAINRRADFLAGYEILYYNYDFNESVKMLNQQYFLGLRINVQRDAASKK